ncbi:ArsR/SmtB family transcription factor [Streptomyces uncialis]|uniref:ArsR family transcriptional regulator n=1 Tax=Streptomyces uncialis TaxID=1048205 RepID=A0A1Q4V0E8_9ACTN|nr:helix-turn-helix domain-containing protein [Streptomyces uncialis]OKH91276.1 ArsR family transcriptional regulator [Streptomyces uncialis]WTE11196.1 helix-turn-helix domain-containing protein [Streptomyces uncialis]
MRPLPQPSTESLTLAPVLHALGDPVRLELVRRAMGSPDSTCSALAEGLTVPLSTLSNHWRILREAGLISMTVDGRHRRIRLRADDLGTRFPDLLGPILRLAATESPSGTP